MFQDAVTIDTSGFSELKGEENTRFWEDKSGDIVGVYFFDLPPDLPRDLNSIYEMKAFYESSLGSSKLVECELDSLGGYQALRTIIKKPQEPSGMTYIGSITLPFDEFSFVLKAVCPEHGVTGIRETVLGTRLMSSGEITFDEKAGRPRGKWSFDDEKYDAEFPNHPLSRTRMLLEHIRTTVTVHGSLAACQSFPLPPHGNPPPKGILGLIQTWFG